MQQNFFFSSILNCQIKKKQQFFKMRKSGFSQRIKNYCFAQVERCGYILSYGLLSGGHALGSHSRALLSCGHALGSRSHALLCRGHDLIILPGINFYLYGISPAGLHTFQMMLAKHLKKSWDRIMFITVLLHILLSTLTYRFGTHSNCSSFGCRIFCHFSVTQLLSLAVP